MRVCMRVCVCVHVYPSHTHTHTHSHTHSLSLTLTHILFLFLTLAIPHLLLAGCHRFRRGGEVQCQRTSACSSPLATLPPLVHWSASGATGALAALLRFATAQSAPLLRLMRSVPRDSCCRSLSPLPRRPRLRHTRCCQRHLPPLLTRESGSYRRPQSTAVRWQRLHLTVLHCKQSHSGGSWPRQGRHLHATPRALRRLDVCQFQPLPTALTTSTTAVITTAVITTAAATAA